MNIQQLVCVAGLAQIALALGSLVIPKILKWRPELEKVNPLIKQMFWTYAAYIFVINLCFGVLSVLAFRDITAHNKLAGVITGFIATYWISRVAIQFLYFDRAHFPTGKWHKLGEALLTIVFVFLSMVYSWVFYLNL